MALCTPHEKLARLQEEGRFTELMIRQEEVKMLPFGDIWNEYCEKNGVPSDAELYDRIHDYEKTVLSQR